MKCKKNIKMKICLCNKRETYFGFYFFAPPYTTMETYFPCIFYTTKTYLC